MNRTILLVDDDQRLRDLLKDYLNEKNLQVFTCQDFIEAKEVLKFFIFDLIILDRMMPSGDGINLIQVIKKRTNLVKKVLELKDRKNQIVDKKRIKIILKNIRIKSIKNKIDPRITNKIWKNMIAAYIEFERKNFKKKN